MLILILFNIIIIILIYLKYYRIEPNLKFSKEKIEKLDPAIIGYISDDTVYNNYDLILAEILELNSKGYITIEYVKEDISKYNYIIRQNLEKDIGTLKKYELTIIDFLFKEKTEISREELEEKAKTTFDLYEIQYNQFQEQLKSELEEQNLIDLVESKKLKKMSKTYIKISLVLIIFLFILNMFIKTLSIYIPIYIFEKLVSSIMLAQAKYYTDKGIALRNGLIEYKKDLENEEFLVDKKVMDEIIYERRFINSVALHLKTNAKNAFISDQMLENSTQIIKKVSVGVIIAVIVLFTVSVIMLSISRAITMSVEGYFWFFTIMAIIVAAVLDVAHALAVDTKRNMKIK